MLKIEDKIGERIEDYLLRKYNHRHISGKKLARELEIRSKTFYKWLKFCNIQVRTLEDYIIKSPKRPPKRVLDYYYNFLRKPVEENQAERN